MFSKDRALHSLAVAKKCYEISKELNKPEEFCRKMFFLGWNHDIGYEFSNNEVSHEVISANILQSIGMTQYDLLNAIKLHSKTNCECTEWEILSTADLLVDSKGNNVTVEDRLKEIKTRYGKESKEYVSANTVAKKLNLFKDKDERC